MKRSVRPLFSALLFAFFAATLIFRVAIRRRSFSFTSAIAELGTSGLVTEDIIFNETLLEFAAIDPGEPKVNQEVDLISDYDHTRRTHRRHFSSMSRPIPQNRHGNRDIASSKFPVTLRSPQFYRYWYEFKRNLQLWARRRGAYESNIMLDLVKLVKIPIDSHNGAVFFSSKRYSSCAVVGNSGTLLNTQYGGLIDKHEIVIRLNNAKTQSFEKKVGSKTNISFINSNILHQCARRETCYCHPYGETVPIVMYICQPIHVLDYTICRASHRAPLVITDRRFDLLCARIVKYYSVKKFLDEKKTEGFQDWSKAHEGSLFHYSSGMQAVMLAVGICEKVSVFGFGKLNSTKHHYHTNQKAELKLHDYEAEYRLYHDLENNPRAIPFLPKAFNIPLDALRERNVFDTLRGDVVACFGQWDFEPADLNISQESCIHIWHGKEDKVVPFQLQRFILQKQPLINYHKVPQGGHLIVHYDGTCDAILRGLLLGEEQKLSQPVLELTV